MHIATFGPVRYIAVGAACLCRAAVCVIGAASADPSTANPSSHSQLTIADCLCVYCCRPAQPAHIFSSTVVALCRGTIMLQIRGFRGPLQVFMTRIRIQIQWTNGHWE